MIDASWMKDNWTSWLAGALAMTGASILAIGKAMAWMDGRRSSAVAAEDHGIEAKRAYVDSQFQAMWSAMREQHAALREDVRRLQEDNARQEAARASDHAEMGRLRSELHQTQAAAAKWHSEYVSATQQIIDLRNRVRALERALGVEMQITDAVHAIRRH